MLILIFLLFKIIFQYIKIVLLKLFYYYKLKNVNYFYFKVIIGLKIINYYKKSGKQ